MGLTLIATPIGNLDDISLRALKELQSSDYLIAEEIKVLRRRLSHWGIDPKVKKIFKLNEHSSQEEVLELLELCQKHSVAQVSDCGTPSFFDPGFSLVQLCYQHKVSVKVLPGPSSLSTLMSYLPIKTERFEVVGFPPKESSERKAFFEKLKLISHPTFLMDTPYRLERSLQELAQHCPKQSLVLGLSLTEENERVLMGTAKELLFKLGSIKKENFVCMLYPKHTPLKSSI